jgi:hypothetical protein
MWVASELRDEAHDADRLRDITAKSHIIIAYSRMMTAQKNFRNLARDVELAIAIARGRRLL